MGYDIYGMNPKLNKHYPERYNKIMEKYGSGDGWLDWDKKIPKKVLCNSYIFLFMCLFQWINYSVCR